MNEVNKTLYIPLYGKSKVSQQGIILKDPFAEKIWKEEAFSIRGKSGSKWLAYNLRTRLSTAWGWRFIVTTVICRQDGMIGLAHNLNN